jgi:hypothetical protein
MHGLYVTTGCVALLQHCSWEHYVAKTVTNKKITGCKYWQMENRKLKNGSKSNQSSRRVIKPECNHTPATSADE